MRQETVDSLQRAGIQPSAQRLAVAEYVLYTEEHPSADQVFARAKKALPMLSRATVYNTLNLFCKKGLLRELVLSEGKVVFDPNLERHHHFVDQGTGRIHDIPWTALDVKRVERLQGYDVHDYQVVLVGRAHPRAR
jgi:Fe2+ or Zn2+ uptake regulation protein